MANVIVGGIIVLLVGLVVYRIYKKRGSGCSSCSGCGMADSCPSKHSDS